MFFCLILFFLSFSLFDPGGGFNYAEADVNEPNLASLVYYLEVDEEIKAGTAQFVSRILREAEERRVDVFILKLNTPGGLLGATEDISGMLIESDVQTVVYAHRPGGWAFSAGSFILLSADIAVAHPAVSIGAASPVGMGGEQAGEKIVNATAGWIRTLAENTGKNAEMAELLVTENLTLSGREAYEVGLIDLTSESFEGLLEELGLEDADLYLHEQNFFDKVLSFVSLPYLVPLLLSLGLIGLFLVFRSGEIESVGLLGVVFLLLGLWGMGFIELSIMGFLLLFLGLSLLMFEVFYTPADFGISGLVGLVALFLGIVTFANEPFFPGYIGQALFWLLIGIFTATGIIFLVIGNLTTKALRRPVQFGPEVFRGREAVVKSDIDPLGVLEIDGERWSARSSDGLSIPSGSSVKIVDLKGNTLIVEKIIN